MYILTLLKISKNNFKTIFIITLASKKIFYILILVLQIIKPNFILIFI